MQGRAAAGKNDRANTCHLPHVVLDFLHHASDDRLRLLKIRSEVDVGAVEEERLTLTKRLVDALDVVDLLFLIACDEFRNALVDLRCTTGNAVASFVVHREAVGLDPVSREIADVHNQVSTVLAEFGLSVT